VRVAEGDLDEATRGRRGLPSSDRRLE